MLAQKKSGTFLSPLLFAFAFSLKRSAPQVSRRQTLLKRSAPFSLCAFHLYSLTHQKDKSILTHICAASSPIQEGASSLELSIISHHLKAITYASPATIEELKRWFDEYLADLTKDKDLSKVRIVLE